MELEIGLRAVKQVTPLRAWMDRYVLAEFPARRSPADSAVALKWAQSHVPCLRAERDALIASTDTAHGMTVVTRDLVGFRIASARAINPWAEHHADPPADFLRLG